MKSEDSVWYSIIGYWVITITLAWMLYNGLLSWGLVPEGVSCLEFGLWLFGLKVFIALKVVS